jgi:hypothetical protein
VAGVAADAFVAGLVEARLAEVDLGGEQVPAGEWAGEARLRAIPGQIKELADAYQSGVLSAALVFPQVHALEAEQGALEKE